MLNMIRSTKLYFWTFYKHSQKHCYLRSAGGGAGRQWGKACVSQGIHGVYNHGDDVMSAGGCCHKEKHLLLQLSTATNLTHQSTHANICLPKMYR